MNAVSKLPCANGFTKKLHVLFATEMTDIVVRCITRAEKSHVYEVHDTGTQAAPVAATRVVAGRRMQRLQPAARQHHEQQDAEIAGSSNATPRTATTLATAARE